MNDVLFPPLKASFFPDGAPTNTDEVVVLPTASEADGADAIDRLRRLVDAAPQRGWRTALEQMQGGRQVLSYVVSPDRLGLLKVLPLKEDQHLLEIGVSLGQIAIPLAQRVKTLDGLEVVADQARFCRERARQEGVENIRVIAGGSDCRLPYADAAFDGVVLNLVLEWCGNRDQEDHETLQQRLLAEIARVLKPGGFFFINTKNRFSLRLLLGGRDEHMSELRWGSALPRWLGRLVRRRKASLGWLHSYNHLKSMLSKAGFARIESYWAAPEMRQPSEFVPIEGSNLAERRKSGELIESNSRKERLVMRLVPNGLVKYITPGLTFLAYR
jgi:SAM-dependent methyltransferase